MRQWLADPVTDQTLRFALTAAGWLVWLFLASTLVLRLLARVQAGVRWLRRIPLPTPMQATASGMAGAALLAIPGGSSTTAPADPGHGGPAAGDVLDRSTVADPILPGGEREATAPTDGVHLPGGWMPAHTAQQVGAAATLLWIRRRRVYRPRPTNRPGNADLDLADLPVTVRAVQAALSSLSSEPTTATGPEIGWLPPPLRDLPAGGVGLTGPGALDAARGILVTALLAIRPTTYRPQRIITTRTVLDRLLPENIGDLPGLIVTGTEHEAMAVAAAPPYPDRHAETLLLMDSVTDAQVARRTAAFGEGSGVAAVVLLGEWQAGTTWQVNPSGHVHDPYRPDAAGRRLCVLNATATADLLTVIRHAASPAPPPQPASAASQVRIPRQTTPPPAEVRTSEPTPQLRLRLLGEPELRYAGQGLTIRRNATWQVLAFLAIRPEGATAGELVGAIWPGISPRTVTGRLYTTLSDLRVITRTAADTTVITSTDQRYHLQGDHLEVDLWRLRDAARHAATAVTDTTAAWQAVIDAYTGDLAAGRSWAWIDGPREAGRRLVLDAYGHLAEIAPDPQAALALVQEGIRVDPYNEDLHHRAIRLLAAAGDQTALDDLVDRYTQRLAAVGLEPSQQLRGAAA
ncbi:hypothetical protein ACFFWC_22870 [Plantactinospora siamensis]|uniref:Bacterial transcriptional activator domain-containing protein n=1 Tax=Plantactinospora siamensis TaxID=555372 RepID=A0ABV6NVN9_9ACTN